MDCEKKGGFAERDGNNLMLENWPVGGVEHMDQQQRPLACKACDGLGVRIILQGGYFGTCERCKGTGEAEVGIIPPIVECGLTTRSCRGQVPLSAFT